MHSVVWSEGYGLYAVLELARLLPMHKSVVAAEGSEGCIPAVPLRSLNRHTTYEDDNVSRVQCDDAWKLRHGTQQGIVGAPLRTTCANCSRSAHWCSDLPAMWAAQNRWGDLAAESFAKHATCPWNTVVEWLDMADCSLDFCPSSDTLAVCCLKYYAFSVIGET